MRALSQRPACGNGLDAHPEKRQLLSIAGPESSGFHRAFKDLSRAQNTLLGRLSCVAPAVLDRFSPRLTPGERGDMHPLLQRRKGGDLGVFVARAHALEINRFLELGGTPSPAVIAR